jgi:SAM-dependent methyltransferase
MASCPVCSSKNTSQLFKIDDIPVYCNLLWDSRGSAINCPKGNIELHYCGHCGHVFNNAFDPKKMDYTQSYENSLHFSPRFQKFAEELVGSLVERYDLRDKNLLEVGCGKGDFLKLISKKGNNKAIGFDKSYDPKNEPENEKVEGVIFIQDWYSEKYKHIPVDFLLCQHVLEHIEKPKEFLETIKSIIEDKKVDIYFEVPNMLYTLRDLGIWDLIYEHCGYFTPNSLAFLFESLGLEVLNVEEKYLNQFLGIEATNKSDKKGFRTAYSHEQLKELASKFSDSYKEKLTRWETQLELLQKEGKKVILWGGGSKGVTFLNILKNYGRIEAIVDINPRKQGMFTAGTGHQFVKPDELLSIYPDVVIIMNPIYKEEISNTLRGLNINAKVVAENEL